MPIVIEHSPSFAKVGQQYFGAAKSTSMYDRLRNLLDLYSQLQEAEKQRQFEAEQAALQRTFMSRESEKERTWTSSESEKDRTFTAGQSEAQRELERWVKTQDVNLETALAAKQAKLAAMQMALDNNIYPKNGPAKIVMPQREAILKGLGIPGITGPLRKYV